MNPEIRLSIDPYIESDGVLGDRLEVKSPAVRLLNSIELRRDVEVSVFDFDKATNQDVMGLDLSTRSVLLEGDGWNIRIFDGRIAGDVESWMRDNYSSDGGEKGIDLFESRFVRQLNKEVFDRLKDAARYTWYDRIDESMARLAETYLRLGIGIGAGYFGSQELIENLPAYTSAEEDAGIQSVIGVALGLGGLGVAGGMGLGIKDRAVGISRWRERLSMVVPNFELMSKFRSSRELNKFDGELISLDPHLISRSSTSNIRSASGGMTSPAPSSPYPMV